MRFGLFYEHQLPRPWADGSEEQLVQNALGGGEALFDQRLSIEGDEAVAMRLLSELDPSGAGY